MANKKSAKEIIMEAVLKTMEEQKRVPWSSGLLNGMFKPRNWNTGRAYHGFNQFWLSMRFDNPESRYEFATFKQIQAAGGKVKKGEHSAPVLFYFWWDKVRKCVKDEESNSDDCILLAKCYNVFEINSQCEGMTSKRIVEERPNVPHAVIEQYIKNFVKNTGLKLETAKMGGSGFYRPGSHLVSVANIKYYESAEMYYKTLFHELIHSTGNAMKRDMGGMFGSHKYSEEEIVAETGSMLLCSILGIEQAPCENDIEYVIGWSQKLKENPNWLFKGISQAEKSVKYFCEKAGIPMTDQKVDEQAA